MATVDRIQTMPTTSRVQLLTVSVARVSLSAVSSRSLVGIPIRLLDENGNLIVDENGNIITG